MAISNDWNVDYITKQINHVQFKDEITGTDSSIKEITFVDTVADVTNSLNGKYFFIYSATDATKYYVWYKTSGGGVSDPAPTGATGIRIDVTTNDTNAAVATATNTTINAHADFNSTVSTNRVTVTNENFGSCTDASDVNTTFTLTTNTQGVGKTVWSTNALYSYLQDTFDELGQMDDQVPMSAQTPTEYSLINGWFIDEVSIKYLKGGAIKTSGWTGGIIRYVSYAQTTEFVAADIGRTIVGTNANGKILFFDITRARVWVRPTSSATDTFPAGTAYTVTSSTAAGTLRASVISIAVDVAGSGYTTPPTISFTGGTGSGATAIAVMNAAGSAIASITVTEVGGGYTSGTPPTVVVTANGAGSSGAGTATIAGGISGENVWANMFTLGTLESNTAIYVVRNGGKVAAWWPVGQIDILVRVQELGTLIDSGNLMIGAREYSKLYDHFISSGITGGRNPVPLATATDLNNATGQYTAALTSAGITFAVGDRFIVSGTAAKEGTVTAFTGTPATSIDYYLSGTSLTQFVNTNTIVKAGTTTPTSVIGTPSDKVAGYTNVTFAFTTGAGISRNLNNGSGARTYHVEINAGTRTVAQMYEWLKFVNRRGATTNPQLQSAQATGVAAAAGPFVNINGEQYFRAVGGLISTATGVFTPVKASPFGTFAGGKFFGAQGVWITNYATTDAQNFQLIDSNGVTQTPPNTVSVTVSSVVASDRVGVFVLTGASGTVKKTTYNIVAAGQSTGIATVTVNSLIDTETPQAGVLRVVQTNTALVPEQQYEYASWSTASNGVFTLKNYGTAGTPRTATGGTSTVLTDSGANFLTARVRVGDTVTNVTQTETKLVVSVDSATQLTTAALATGTWSGDTYYIDTLTSTAYITSDTVYVPVVNEVINTGNTSVTNTLIKKKIADGGANIPVLVRVRQGKVILPFEIENAIGDSGMSQAAIRTTDTIAT